MYKTIKYSDFDSESVLSNDPWLFVELWLKRKGMKEALNFWTQARRFHDASKNSKIEAAPLTLYYSFLNAIKALLVVRGEKHSDHHGVAGNRPENAKASLANEIITFQTGGILPALCQYLGESVTSQKYDLKNLLWNLPFVHRAFCHTYKSNPDLFIPLENARYVQHPDGNGEAWFEADIVSRYSDRRILRHIPNSFEFFTDEEQITFIRRKKRFKWLSGRTSKAQKKTAIDRLTAYHSKVRRIIVPISATRDLWYLKKTISGNLAGDRHTLVLVFAAMHRLSELARYDPAGLSRHLDGSANWLLTEFIEHSPNQFIDQVASEITGRQFWKPGVGA